MGHHEFVTTACIHYTQLSQVSPLNHLCTRISEAFTFTESTTAQSEPHTQKATAEPGMPDFAHHST